GVVGLEEDVVDADRREQLAGRVLLEEEAAVDLTAEVLARLHRELGPLLRDLRVAEGVVRGLEDERDEADPALDRDHAELRMPREHAREEEIHELLSVLEEEAHRRPRVRAADAVGRDALARELLGEVTAPDVEADRETGLLGRSPERLPVPVREHRLSEA